jgi:hypothetical protein
MTETTPSTEFRTSTTRAAVINGYGGAEQLVVADIPVADPTDSQALLDVAAVSVNPVDLTTRAGVEVLGAVAAERVEELRALGANDAVGRDAVSGPFPGVHAYRAKSRSPLRVVWSVGGRGPLQVLA